MQRTEGGYIRLIIYVQRKKEGSIITEPILVGFGCRRNSHSMYKHSHARASWGGRGLPALPRGRLREGDCAMMAKSLDSIRWGASFEFVGISLCTPTPKTV
jgi:hypothetical protein